MKWNVFWESNPTNIKSPVFWGNTAITLISQKTLRDPIFPMFSLFLSVFGVYEIRGHFVSVNLGVFRRNWGKD